MRKSAGVCLVPVAAALLLAGCGDSHPLPQSPSAASGPASASTAPAATPAPGLTQTHATSAAPAYVSAAGAFAPAATAMAGNAARVVDDCNVDSIDGKPIEGVSLARTSGAVFAGWAADSATSAVPNQVRLVLKNIHGGQDFAVEIATGEARPDVAQVRKVPAFATSGWSVDANLSAVAPGRYDTVLHYRIGGKPVTCDPHHAVTIR